MSILKDPSIRFGLWAQQWALFAVFVHGLFAGWSALSVCGWQFLWAGVTAWARAPSLFEECEEHIATWLITTAGSKT
jgi:hypothetical protein